MDRIVKARTLKASCSRLLVCRLEGRWALFDAAQHRRELVDLIAALELPFVPPGRASVDERSE